jgi:methylglutaconyl-CoA hydratase
VSAAELTIRDDVAVLSLARPDAANSFNAAVIAELVAHLKEIAAMKQVRAVVLRGKGKHFSAGADLAWMKASAALSFKDNVTDAKALIALFEALANLPQPTLAAVHGSAFGGAVGLTACCDIAIAADTARFALSEVKLGLMPAVIVPDLMRKMTPGGLRRLGLTGKIFSAAEAKEAGLVERVVPEAELAAAVKEELNLLLQGSPEAQAKLKTLLDQTQSDGLRQHPRTAEAIAGVRTGKSGQAGLAAFFDKKPPPWAKSLAADWSLD